MFDNPQTKDRWEIAKLLISNPFQDWHATCFIGCKGSKHTSADSPALSSLNKDPP